MKDSPSGELHSGPRHLSNGSPPFEIARSKQRNDYQPPKTAFKSRSRIGIPWRRPRLLHPFLSGWRFSKTLDFFRSFTMFVRRQMIPRVENLASIAVKRLCLMSLCPLSLPLFEKALGSPSTTTNFSRTYRILPMVQSERMSAFPREFFRPFNLAVHYPTKGGHV